MHGLIQGLGCSQEAEQGRKSLYEAELRDSRGDPWAHKYGKARTGKVSEYPTEVSIR